MKDISPIRQAVNDLQRATTAYIHVAKQWETAQREYQTACEALNALVDKMDKESSA